MTTEIVTHGLQDGLDLSRYRSYVAHLGLAPEREDAVLLSVWAMMGGFVDRAFGDDPVQHVHEIRAKDEGHSTVMLGSTKSQTKDASLSSAFSKPAAGRRKKERS